MQENLVSAEICKVGKKSDPKGAELCMAEVHEVAAGENVSLKNDTVPWYVVGFSSYSKVVQIVACIICFLNCAGLIRSKTIMSNHIDDSGFKYLAVMDPGRDLTKLLITYTDKRLNHAGMSITMRTLRKSIWIISSRTVIRSVVNGCHLVTCRRYTAKTLQAPPAYLPLNRVRGAAVFEVIGVDYAGPLYLQDGPKAWPCLFTCAVYCAFHFELVTTLSTN